MERQNTSSIFAAFLLILMGAGSLAQEVPCTATPILTHTNGASWPLGAHVTVIMNAVDFPTTAERSAIQSAFTTWQNANPNSGVTFGFTTGGQPTSGSQLNTYYVRRGTTQTGGATNIGFSGSQTTTGNVTQSAITIVDSSMTRLTTITNMMIHEIGHTFGLGDCFSCDQGSTIMSDYRTDCFCPSYPCDQSVPFNGMRWGCPPLQAPRDCDVTTVAQLANYPAPPTPTPTPTPECAQNGWSCWVGVGCCFGVCGELSNSCIPCEPNPQNIHEQCMTERCMSCYAGGGVHCTGEGFNCWTPIIVDVAGNGFDLTNASNGVVFNDGKGTLLRTAWTKPNSDDAWLVLDRNGNGMIDDGTELFGNAAPQPPTNELYNGFRALSEYDKSVNGGNEDGRITDQDAGFVSLRLWQDINQDGVSAEHELHSLPSLNLAVIELNYKMSKYVDANGNTFKFRAKIRDSKGAQIGRWVYDVFLDARRA